MSIFTEVLPLFLAMVGRGMCLKLFSQYSSTHLYSFSASSSPPMSFITFAGSWRSHSLSCHQCFAHAVPTKPRISNERSPTSSQKAFQRSPHREVFSNFPHFPPWVCIPSVFFIKSSQTIWKLLAYLSVSLKNCEPLAWWNFNFHPCIPRLSTEPDTY